MSGPQRTCVLTIAGSDSGAGAGIQADSRTIHAFGGYALTAVTAVTAQNTRGVTAWKALPPELIGLQIEAVFADFPVKAVKTGLLPGTAAILAVEAALKAHARLPLIIDPVIASTSGTRFLTQAGLRALKQRLLPRAALVTPNWPEAEALTGVRILSDADVERAALRLLETGCGAVLLKGGHGGGATCSDCLAASDGSLSWFMGPRIATRNTHGTGCVLSSAIATALAAGRPLRQAVEDARCFLLQSLEEGRGLRWGKGKGPAFVPPAP
jgi:hydroxymethylpyrimidine/phosphomethylpyrimidine kinase